jgi:hypothetical protein
VPLWLLLGWQAGVPVLQCCCPLVLHCSLLSTLWHHCMAGITQLAALRVQSLRSVAATATYTLAPVTCMGNLK